MEIIEDVIPLYNVSLQVRMENKPAKVYLAPEKIVLEFNYENGYVKFTVPELNGHQMVVFDDPEVM